MIATRVLSGGDGGEWAAPRGGWVAGRYDVRDPLERHVAEEFAARFDAFSIGSNDLTQLVLGVGRDSAELRSLFDERDEAVKRMIAEVIHRAHACGAKVGSCGEGPSNPPDFAAFLVRQGLDSISLNPDGFVAAARSIAEAEGVTT